MPKRSITLALPKPLKKKITTQMTTIVMTTGVGLVEPTIPVRFDAGEGADDLRPLGALGDAGGALPPHGRLVHAVGADGTVAVGAGRRRQPVGMIGAGRGRHRMPASSSARTRRATCSGSFRSQRPGEAM